MSCSSPLSDTAEISTDMANDETTIDDCLSTTDESQQEASGGESSSGGDPTEGLCRKDDWSPMSKHACVDVKDKDNPGKVSLPKKTRTWTIRPPK